MAVIPAMKLFGSLAILVQFDFRPMTLRRRVSPVLLFIGATLLSRFLIRISIQHLF